MNNRLKFNLTPPDRITLKLFAMVVLPAYGITSFWAVVSAELGMRKEHTRKQQDMVLYFTAL